MANISTTVTDGGAQVVTGEDLRRQLKSLSMSGVSGKLSFSSENQEREQYK